MRHAIRKVEFQIAEQEDEYFDYFITMLEEILGYASFTSFGIGLTNYEDKMLK